VALGSTAQGWAPGRPRSVCQGWVVNAALVPGAPGLTQLLPFHFSHFWEVFWAPCRKEVSGTRCKNGIISHHRNYQKQKVERRHSDTKNVFMIPKEK